MARLKGSSPFRVILWHALPDALAPTVNMVALVLQRTNRTKRGFSGTISGYQVTVLPLTVIPIAPSLKSGKELGVRTVTPMAEARAWPPASSFARRATGFTYAPCDTEQP